jgi:DNA-directed RNA polymerase
MSVALRDCFIKLHSRNLLEELKAGFQERYSGYIVRKNKSVTKIVRKKHQATSDFVTTSSMSNATGSSVEEVSVLQGEMERLANVTTAELSKVFPQIPPRGDFDLEIIRDSPYCFS